MAGSWSFDITKVENDDLQEISRVKQAMALEHPTITAFLENAQYITYPGYENASLQVKFCIWVSKLLQKAPERLLSLHLPPEAGNSSLQVAGIADRERTTSQPVVIRAIEAVSDLAPALVPVVTELQSAPSVVPVVTELPSAPAIIATVIGLPSTEIGTPQVSSTAEISTAQVLSAAVATTEVPSSHLTTPPSIGAFENGVDAEPAAGGVAIEGTIVSRAAAAAVVQVVEAQGEPAVVACDSPQRILQNRSLPLTAPRSSPRFCRPIPPGVPLNSVAAARSSGANKRKLVLNSTQLLVEEEERREHLMRENAAAAAERLLERARVREIEDARQQRLDEDRKQEKKESERRMAERKAEKKAEKKKRKKERQRSKGKKGKKSRRHRRSSSSSTSSSTCSSSGSTDSEEIEVDSDPEDGDVEVARAPAKQVAEDTAQPRLQRLDLNRYTRILKGKDEKAIKNQISQTAYMYFPVNEWKHWRQLKKDKRLMRSFHDEVRNVWKNGREIDDAWINCIASRVLKDRHYRQKAAVRALYDDVSGTYGIPDGMEETLWLPIVAELTGRRNSSTFRRAHMGDNGVNSKLRRRTTNVWGYGGYPHFYNTFITIWKREPTQDEIDFAREHSSKELYRKLRAEAEGVIYMAPPPVMRIPQQPLPPAPAPLVLAPVNPRPAAASGSSAPASASTPAPPVQASPSIPEASRPNPAVPSRQKTIKVTMGRDRVIHTDTDGEDGEDLEDLSSEDERVETEQPDGPEQDAELEDDGAGVNKSTQEKKRKNPYAPSRDRPAMTRASSSGKGKKEKPSKKKTRKDRS